MDKCNKIYIINACANSPKQSLCCLFLNRYLTIFKTVITFLHTNGKSLVITDVYLPLDLKCCTPVFRDNSQHAAWKKSV